MESCSKGLAILLNGVQDHVDGLVKDIPAQLLAQPSLDFGCAVIYGNDPIVLDAFFYKMVRNLHEKDKLTLRQNELYTYSDYHFEFEFDSDFMAHIQTIQGIKRSRSINGSPHLVYIKGLTKPRCKYLHHIIDTLGNNMVVVIAARSLCDVDENIRSRALMLNLSLDRDKMFAFCERHVKPGLDAEVFNEAYARSLGNVVGTILRIESGGFFAFEECVLKTVDTMQKSKSFLSAVLAMRETAYKIFHMNVPFAAVCKVILERFRDSAKQGTIAECCACHEHMISMTYKDLFVYERFFMEVMQIAKIPEPKAKAAKATKATKAKVGSVVEASEPEATPAKPKRATKTPAPAVEQATAPPSTDPKPIVKRGRKVVAPPPSTT